MKMTSLLKPIAVLLGITVASGAQAVVQIDIFDTGPDVQMELSGSFDLSGGTNPGTVFDTVTAGLKADRFFGIRAGQDFSFRTFANTGPSSFGPGDFETLTAVSSGDTFFFNFGTNRLGLATDYVSGAALEASATFENTRLDLLGLTAGEYEWNFANGEQINLSIAPAVPLPAGGLLLIGGLGTFAALRKRKRFS